MLTSNFIILPLMEVSVKSGEGQSSLLIESLRPLCIVFGDCAVHLAPGYPVYFSEEQAWKVIEKASGKVRVLNDPGHAFPGELIEGEPVIWKSGEGLCGPAIVHIISCTEEGRWMLVWHEGRLRWIHESKVIQRMGRKQ
jgi:hypothetical protein